MGIPARGEDVRLKLALIILGVLVALVLLYLANLFYIQFLLLVWGAAIMLGTYVYDRRAARQPDSSRGKADSEKIASLETTLASVQEKLAGPLSPAERQGMRSQEAVLERELRRLRWSSRERDMEALGKASGHSPLRALPARMGYWARKRQQNRERSHLLESLDEAQGVLVAEPLEAARTRIAMIAADLRANHGMLRDLEGSGNAGDYAAAWAVLYAISNGESPSPGIFGHVPKRAKSKLVAILESAASRGIVTSAAAGT